MAQLFISYSTRNADFARYLRGLLQDAGFDVWMDETKLSAGQSWTDTLEANITNCAAFVIIMSPEAKASEWVRRERLLAERLHKPMFPILYSGEAWWDLANIQYEDMRAGLKAALSPRMIDALRRAVSGEAPPPEIESAGSHTPVPAPTQTDSRKLEAAMPAETKAGSDTEVWAKISLPASEGLRGELPAVVPSGDVIQKGDARASTFPLRFPLDPRTGQRLPIQAELRLSAGDFLIAASEKQVEVEDPPDSDSRTVIFTLEANPQGKMSGRSRIVIDLIYEAKIIAQISVSTVLVAQVTAAVPNWTLASVSYAAPPTGSVAASAGANAPGASATTETATRSVPSAQPSLSAPPDAVSQFRDEQERGSYGARESETNADDGPLPTYDEDAKTSAPLDDYVPQPATPQYSGSASRATDMEMFDEPLAKRAPRRASNTPLRLASLFAALALVMVVALTLTKQNTALNANGVATATLVTQFALLPTETFAQVSATDGSAIQAATSVALTMNAQGVTSGDIAVAPLIGCTGSPGSGLVGLLKTAGLDSYLLENGIATKAETRQLTDTHIVAWGECNKSSLTLHLEILAAPTVSGYGAPSEITITTQPDAVTESDSHAVRLALAVTEYAVGSSNYTMLAQTFEDLSASATNADERASLRTLQQNSVYLATHYPTSTATGG